jgi:tRNA pseudouridine38-40 synthase
MTDNSSTRNFKLILQYDGMDYHGSQLQVGVRTIQGVLEEALEKVLGVKTRIHASGRTDTGVHALGQVVHFFADSDIAPEQLIGRLNDLLPEDIRILSAEEVPATFHSRYGATSKVYRYTILNAKIHGRYCATSAYVFPAKLDLDRMRKAAEYLVGTHDFSAFGVNPGQEVKSPVKTIKRLEVRQQGNYIFIEVEADGFLYKMVRSIVGTLVKVGVGKIEPEQMPAILASRDRCRAGATAPPQGLCLVEVKYSRDKT